MVHEIGGSGDSDPDTDLQINARRIPYVQQHPLGDPFFLFTKTVFRSKIRVFVS